MALNAEVGSPDANSYVTLDEANDYFANRAFSESWDSAEDKEQQLITASQLLDWYIKWKGYKTDSEQGMGWPRTGVTLPSGTEVSDSIIPKDVKTATFELVLSSLDGDRTSDDPLAGIEQVKAGSLMVKADDGDAHSTAKSVIPDHVWKIISDLYSRGSIGVVRLMRA